MTARAMVTSAGTKHAAQRLLAAEGKIPSHVLCSNHFQYWQHWRRSVEAAQAPAELSPLVRVSHVHTAMLSCGSQTLLTNPLGFGWHSPLHRAIDCFSACPRHWRPVSKKCCTRSS